ncbi:hypothetical protein BHM03_00059609 [Ensete ventricosum]|nr:hypothetical protein BHM03_00059609 [Ensete ventricosum]
MAGVSEGRKAVEMSQSAGFESSGGAIAMAATGNLITMRQRGRDFTCWNPPLLGRRRANTNETSGRFGGNETSGTIIFLIRFRQFHCTTKAEDEDDVDGGCSPVAAMAGNTPSLNDCWVPHAALASWRPPPKLGYLSSRR